MSQISTTIGQGLVLLEPVRCDTIEPTCVYCQPTLEDLLRLPPPGTAVALDFETRGTDASDPNFMVVGAGLAWWAGEEIMSVYYNLNGINLTFVKALVDKLFTYELSAHNVMFDAAALWRMAKDLERPELWANWSVCTYGLYRQLASEGHPSQRWSLEYAQYELLGWERSNKDDVAEWLIAHGFTKRQKDGYVADKAELWRVPPEILGRYCCMDASSTLQLLSYVLLPAVDRFPEVMDYHQKEFMDLTKSILEAFFRGIWIDKEALEAHVAKLESDIVRLTQGILDYPAAKSGVEEYNKFKIEEIRAKEPAKLTKAGKESANWVKWKAKLEKAEATQHFNLASPTQLNWLLYEWMEFPAKFLTDSGGPSSCEDALLGMGEFGRLIIDERALETELGFIKTCLEKLRFDAAEGRWLLHPQYRNPGTLTERLAGTGGLNVQQLPHSPGYLACWKPRPGNVFIDSDFNSLEQVVLAELSEDKGLWQLYGPDAVPGQDVYLFNAAHYPPTMEAVRKWYDPYNPTPESKKLAKEHCSKERALAKTATLALAYGCGPAKLVESFNVAGFDLDFNEAKDVYDAHWALYGGTKRYEARLKQEWRDRGGWVYNGLRRPKPVAALLEKDLCNRVVQSTGHDLLMKLNSYVRKLRAEHGVNMWPVIPDFHDEILFECAEEDKDKAKCVVEEAYALLNKEVDGKIPLRGSFKVCRSMAEVKED